MRKWKSRVWKSGVFCQIKLSTQGMKKYTDERDAKMSLARAGRALAACQRMDLKEIRLLTIAVAAYWLIAILCLVESFCGGLT